jgi:hypothetical protein
MNNLKFIDGEIRQNGVYYLLSSALVLMGARGFLTF